ncbi:hypothetical protein ACROYT_G022795 [Oculina patagonica]
MAASDGWHWSCASNYCKNSWKSAKVHYYTLTKVASASKKIQDAYLDVLGKRKNEVNFKKQVICSKHWSSGERLDLDDLPNIKFTEAGNLKSPKVKREHWYCAATLCTNSWRTKNKSLKYYRLKEIASCPEKRRATTDNELTADCGVLDMIQDKGATVLTDKGLGIEDLCHVKGLSHNRPPMKFDAQYEETDIAKNFDVATLRIYNENYIGRMRDWSILNACWPKNRCDILGCVYKVLANIVNMLFDPICAKEATKSKSRELSHDDTAPLAFFI